MTLIPQVNPDEEARLRTVAERLHVSREAPGATAAAEMRGEAGEAARRPLGAVLAALDQAIAVAGPGDRPGLILALAARLAQLGVGLAVPAMTGNRGPGPLQEVVDERLLSPEQAAAIVGGVSAKWMLRHTKGLRFRRDLSRKVVRFEESGLRRWVGARRA